MNCLASLAKTIVSFIQTHHMLLAIYCWYELAFSLSNPIKTQFATNFFMVDRLVNVQEAIEKINIDLDWLVFFNFLRNSHRRGAISKVVEVRKNV